MVDNIGYTPGTGATVAADDIGGVLVQRVKITAGADGTATDLLGDATNGLDVDVTRLPSLPAGSNTIGGVTDGGGSLTVDAPVATPVFVRLSDGAAAITTLPVSNTNLDVALSTRLKPADTLAGVTTVGAVTAITNALPAGTNNIGDVDVLTLPALTALAAATSTPHAVVSLGNSQGKTVIGKPGSLASSATTANQTITGASWTVTAAKTGYITHVDVSARLTTFAATATLFGTVSLRIGGTAIATWELAGTGFQYSAWLELAESLPVAAGTVIDIVCTPAAATAMTWKANLVGYEK